MSSVSRRIANLLILMGLVIIAIGLVLMYPFVHDALSAQYDPPTALSFVVTLPPAPTLPAGTPSPVSRPTASPSPASIPATVSVTAVTPGEMPAPIVLPDNSTSGGNGSAAAATVQPAPVTTGSSPDRLVIEAIDLDAPVVTVGWHVEQGMSVWDVPDRRAAGWLKTSAPAGQPGNTVLDGHHNITGEVFRRLVDLQPGDAISLYAGDMVYRYAVTEKHILRDRDQPIQVRIANAQWIQPTDDERLTLVTCWPYTNNTHRLIIVARPLPSPSDRKMGGIE